MLALANRLVYQPEGSTDSTTVAKRLFWCSHHVASAQWGGEKWAELELEMSHEPLSQQPLSNEHSSALLQAVRRFRRFRRVLLPKRLFHPSPLSAWRRVARASPRRIAPAMAPMASKLLAAAASGKGGGWGDTARFSKEFTSSVRTSLGFREEAFSIL